MSTKQVRKQQRQAEAFFRKNFAFKKAVKAEIAREKKKNSELKYHDVSVKDALVSDALLNYPLSDIARGTGEQQRDGDSISPYKLLIKLGFNYNTADDKYIYVRAFVLKSRTEVAPTGGEYIGNATSSPISWPDSSYFSDKNQTLVWERGFMLTEQAQPYKYLEIKTKLSGQIFYDGSGATSTGAGHMNLFIVATNSVGDTIKPVVDIHTRLLYYDN